MDSLSPAGANQTVSAKKKKADTGANGSDKKTDQKVRFQASPERGLDTHTAFKAMSNSKTPEASRPKENKNVSFDLTNDDKKTNAAFNKAKPANI